MIRNMIFIMFLFNANSYSKVCNSNSTEQISYINGFLEDDSNSNINSFEVMSDIFVADYVYNVSDVCSKVYFNHNHGLMLNTIELVTQVNDEIKQEYLLDANRWTLRDTYQYFSYVIRGISFAGLMKKKINELFTEALYNSVKESLKKSAEISFKSYYEEGVASRITLEMESTTALMIEDLNKDLLVRSVLLVSKDQGAIFANEIADSFYIKEIDEFYTYRKKKLAHLSIGPASSTNLVNVFDNKLGDYVLHEGDPIYLALLSTLNPVSIPNVFMEEAEYSQPDSKVYTYQLNPLTANGEEFLSFYFSPLAIAQVGLDKKSMREVVRGKLNKLMEAQKATCTFNDFFLEHDAKITLDSDESGNAYVVLSIINKASGKSVSFNSDDYILVSRPKYVPMGYDVDSRPILSKIIKDRSTHNITKPGRYLINDDDFFDILNFVNDNNNVDIDFIHKQDYFAYSSANFEKEYFKVECEKPYIIRSNSFGTKKFKNTVDFRDLLISFEINKESIVDIESFEVEFSHSSLDKITYNISNNLDIYELGYDPTLTLNYVESGNNHIAVFTFKYFLAKENYARSQNLDLLKFKVNYKNDYNDYFVSKVNFGDLKFEDDIYGNPKWFCYTGRDESDPLKSLYNNSTITFGKYFTNDYPKISCLDGPYETSPTRSYVWIDWPGLGNITRKTIKLCPSDSYSFWIPCVVE